MRPSRRLLPPLLFAVLCVALCVATTLVWVRSYWRVDKAWLQILPKYTADLQLSPGHVTFGGAPSAVRLPVGEGDWFTWPVDSYYAEYIPPPTNTFRGDFEIYNGRVTIPFWFALLGVMSLGLFSVAPAILRHAAASRSTRPRIFPADLAAEIPAGTLRLRDDPMVALTPAQTTPVHLELEPPVASPAFEAAVAFEATIPMTAAVLAPDACHAAEPLQAVS